MSGGRLNSLEIAARAEIRPMEQIAEAMGLPGEFVEPYGSGVAKIDLAAIDALQDRPRAKYVLVTAVTPTPLGEGKTTTTVGLGQGLQHIGRRAVLALRQPSLGPTMGIKGGGAGAGRSQVVPMERLNLHLTGDIHAVAAAHNQLAAQVDNHLMRGAPSGLDPARTTWRRTVDIDDRPLRRVVVGLGGNGTVRETGFDITAASEVMAALSLSRSLADLRERMGRIVVGWTRDGDPVTAEDIRAAGAMTVLLKQALRPNLMQTIEHTPVLVHCGPFGNIATGNSSVVADLIGQRCGEFLVTEAGFASDMGAERFFNIKCRVSGLAPDAAVVVTTVRALKAHSGRHRVVAGRPLPDEMLAENPDEVREGADNLRHHIGIVRRHGVPVVVAVNAFASDHASEHDAIRRVAAEEGAACAVSTHVADGGEGAAELAELVVQATQESARFEFLYPEQASLEEKITAIATQVYGADGVDISPGARRDLDEFTRRGYGSLPVCVAKTHLSLSADPSLRGAPTGWRLPVREVRLSAGAGFVYLICGDMQTMPGLGSAPAAEQIDIDENGETVGLY
ncbi:formate--tetrahydrofolate ligase [Microbacterium sp. JB110]|uniref:formate--tetrahydrofolate ligase n=1 Tax=Microbacterium sp. JB110 TaxID=2024477 RepID=UPI00097F60D0|nr:formate--tetrahydrofolate ligase [Microbacterium sp. JB110]RCS57314.1 formate--tetrahydrofolate ligase [Microbacterium sp. JB110]SJM58253.1 Formate--tetrahydrofolate ligase [Frigoribacterium sp. JB110]